MSLYFHIFLLMVRILENILYHIEKIVWSAPLTAILMFTHIYFTIRLKVPQKNVFKGLRLMFQNDHMPRC